MAYHLGEYWQNLFHRQQINGVTGQQLVGNAVIFVEVLLNHIIFFHFYILNNNTLAANCIFGQMACT
jgi:hypothetical protein